jgi:hypothetical protein
MMWKRSYMAMEQIKLEIAINKGIVTDKIYWVWEQ